MPTHQLGCSLGYDGLDRLTAARGVWGTGSYTYDALDNLRSSQLGRLSLTMHVDPATNRLNRVSGWLNYDVQYDANGNVYRRGDEGYSFDIANRLQNVWGRANHGYDGHGRRVWTGYADGRTLFQGYGLGGKLLFSWDSVKGDRRYVYLGDRLIAETEHQTGVTTFSHNDALGSPVVRTNSSGQEVARTHYEPYGATAEGTVPNGIGFTGHVNDADTGLVYMQQRYYEPRAGRFLSVDPVATSLDSAGSFNRYVYVHSNPFRYIDPDGRVAGDMQCRRTGQCRSVSYDKSSEPNLKKPGKSATSDEIGKLGEAEGRKIFEKARPSDKWVVSSRVTGHFLIEDEEGKRRWVASVPDLVGVNKETNQVDIMERKAGRCSSYTPNQRLVFGGKIIQVLFVGETEVAQYLKGEYVRGTSIGPIDVRAEKGGRVDKGSVSARIRSRGGHARPF